MKGKVNLRDEHRFIKERVRRGEHLGDLYEIGVRR